jgi:TetR/AcrR family transcriptional repressor of nem operon
MHAKTQGELSGNVDLTGLADFFESTLTGIRMAAKSGKSRQALRNIAEIAGQVYVEAGR